MQKNKKPSQLKVPTTSAHTISYVLVLLYLLVSFVPLFGAVDYDAPEWLYVSLLNAVSLVFIFKNKEDFKVFIIPKHIKIFFLVYLGFFFISCLSIITAINVSESLVQLARLVSMIVAMYCLYVFIRLNPKGFFDFFCKITVLLLLFYSWKAFSYSLGNYESPRTQNFINALPHSFSNGNIYTAFIVIQLPFAIYGSYFFKKIWKYAAIVSLFLTTYALIFVGSRAALLSLFIIYIFLIITTLHGLIKLKIGIKKEALLLLLLPILSLIMVLNVNRLDNNSSNSFTDIFILISKENYEDSIKLQEDDENLSHLVADLEGVGRPNNFAEARISLWNLAYRNFKHNPLLGIGYGNYKATAKKEYYRSARVGVFKNPRRAHNDLFEKLAETGVIGFLLYAILLLYPLILIIRILIKEKQFERRFLYISIFLATSAYLVDAFFNFPLERAPIQLLFSIIVIFILINFKKNDEVVSKTKSVYHVPLILILFLCTFSSIASNYAVLNSYQLQRSMMEDLKGKRLFTDQKLNNTYQSIKEQWINYPELSYVGTANNVYLANYAIKEKKYEEALEILNRSNTVNKDALLVKSFKSEIYLNIYDKIDSAKHYSEDVFDIYPSFKTNYNLLKKIYRKEKDTASIMRIMNIYTKYNFADVNEWQSKANTVYDYTGNSELLLKVLDTGIAYNPSSIKLLEAKKEVLDKLKFKSYLTDKEVKAKHQEAFDYFATQDYDKAKDVFEEILITNPKDYLSIQNIGIIDLVQKNYEEAIKSLTKVIKANAFTDGKAEYSRGYCYEQLGQLEKAKADYKKSRLKNYSQAMALPASKYE
ncbi:O-antigen ligase family protein [Nonlabens dokdonensis]|nr:O-antigen ligase family protein [Nonlabens dokdonensis]